MITKLCLEKVLWLRDSMKETAKNVIMQKCELSRICIILYWPHLTKLNEIYNGIAQNNFEKKLANASLIHHFFKCLRSRNFPAPLRPICD